MTAESAGSLSGELTRQLPYFVQSAPLIGRAAELAEVTGLLTDRAIRLVTITGRSGIGKTRLALEAARRLDAAKRGSALFVSLAAVGDPDLVLPAIAAQLDVTAGPGVPLSEVVARCLRRAPVVLLLDNFEHLLPAADQLAAVLDSCPDLRLLITSQAPLRLAGERVVRLAPLALPEPDAGAEAAAAQPAVALYCDRAKAADHRFDLQAGNAAAVVSLCRELEGLPLAIELAAARATTLPAADLASRLEQRRLDVLHSPRPGAPSRHHDMRAAIGWTYGLLSDFQRLLLRKLAVAGGTFDIDDVGALGDGAADVLDALSTLVDIHLVTPARAEGPARFELLPSIRDFAAEELAASGEAARTEDRWIGWLCGQARRAAAGITAQAPDAWWIWLEGAHDCLRNALQRCLDDGRAAEALDLAAGLAPYWDARAAHSAHSRLLDRAIDLGVESGLQPAALAEALLWSGLMGIRVLITDRADFYVERLKRGEELARESGDERLLLLAANCRALTTMMTGDVERGLQAVAEGLELARRRDEPCWLSRFELHSARAAQAAGDDRMVALSIAAMENARRAGDSRSVLNAAFMLQTLAPASRAAAAAIPPPQELLTMARQTHQRISESVLLPLLTVQTLAAGDIPAAARWCAAALDISGFDPTSYPAGYALFAAVEVAGRHGDYELAARIHGRLRETLPRLHAVMPARFVTAHEAILDEVRAGLGTSGFDDAVEAGSGWPWDLAVAEVTGYLSSFGAQDARAPSLAGPATAKAPLLTDRLMEVVRLLAAGLTNKEIAARLGLTPKTVMHYTVAIYERIGARGRSEAVAWAIRSGVAPADRP
jgi:predicted ATPase/DNA-binding CsgD family transcriptional regulator